MPSAMINGVDLYYECDGKGEPLMLVAGLASDSQSWQPIVEALSRNYLVIRPDNRGTGRTTPQDIETSIRQIADDCIALAQYLGLPLVTLVGHSMGGFVALDCAIRYPERVANLILAGTSACNSARNNALFRDWAADLRSSGYSARWFRNIFYWIFSTGLFDDSDALNQAVRLSIEYPYPQRDIAFEMQVAAIAGFDCRENLQAIRAGTLIVCGKQDLLFPPEESIEVLGAIPGARICIVDNAAHAIHIENPGAFTDCVLDFLSASRA